MCQLFYAQTGAEDGLTWAHTQFTKGGAFTIDGSADPKRVGTIVVSMLNVLQDAPGSPYDKAAAVSCLFREVVSLCRSNVSLRSSTTEFLEYAENLSTEQVTGLPKPEFMACHEFVKNELAKTMQNI